jgi:hypothetical protein
MRRIGSFIVKDAQKVENETDPGQIITNNTVVLNSREPLSSNDLPEPISANYYKGDDYVYHFINGLWKRTSLNKFNTL